jgi:hypothetical protein
MEYFGFASASAPGATVSWAICSPPACNAKAASGKADNIPAAPMVLKKERRPTFSNCISFTPVIVARIFDPM